MPVLKHAKKKLKQDKKRTADNLKVKELYKKLVKAAKVKPTTEAVRAAYSAIDKAAKHNIIHANKASRLKASLVKKTTDGKSEEAPKKKATSKSSKSSKKSAKK